VQRLLVVVATGALFSAFSEFWFYQVGTGTSDIVLVLLYGLVGYHFWLTLHYFQVRGFAGFFVAAGLFGFAVEGIPVPVLYEALPFSIAWTSLAWHALLTVSVGLFYYRKVMTGGSRGKIILLNLTIGVGLGIWNGYIWNAGEDPDTAALVYVWISPWTFAGQFLIGYALFLAGHWIFDRLGWSPLPVSRGEYFTLSGLLLVLFALGQLLPLFPLSLVFLLLVAISVGSLANGQRTAKSDWLVQMFARRLMLQTYLYSLLIPATAIPVYWAIFEVQLIAETNAIVAGVTVLISVVLWLAALARLNRLI